jgi:hypothetical protein
MIEVQGRVNAKGSVANIVGLPFISRLLPVLVFSRSISQDEKTPSVALQ